MTRPNPYATLANPDSAMVKDALSRTCEACTAPPEVICLNTLGKRREGVALPLPDGRLVHYARCSP